MNDKLKKGEVRTILEKLINCGLETYLLDYGQYLELTTDGKISIKPITPYPEDNILGNGNYLYGRDRKISPEVLKITVENLLENHDLHISIKELIINNLEMF